MGPFWESPGRPVCIMGDDPLPMMVLPESSEWRFGPGSSVSQVDGRVTVSHSPTAIVCPCTGQSFLMTSQGPVGGPTLAEETLFPGPPSGTNLASQADHHTAVGLASSQFIAQKLSEAVLDSLDGARASSTCANY